MKVLGLEVSDAINTPAFDLDFQESAETIDNMCKARILGYAVGTWVGYANAIKSFLGFCKNRQLSPFECTPSILNLYLMWEAQQGRTVAFFDKFLAVWSFVSRFYLCQDFTKDPIVCDVKKFLQKACPRNDNKKKPFGANEVRKIWDAIDKKGGVSALTDKEFCSFMIAVFQHKTFCRFSELRQIKVENLLHDIDYFKIHVKFSKTDQGGKGQWLYLPEDSSGYRDPHMLMCLYVHHLELDKKVPSPHMYLFPPLH